MNPEFESNKRARETPETPPSHPSKVPRLQEKETREQAETASSTLVKASRIEEARHICSDADPATSTPARPSVLGSSFSSEQALPTPVRLSVRSVRSALNAE